MKELELYADNWSEKAIEEAKNLPGPILVVGASGFIGSKLFFSLLNRRSDVFACSKNAKSSWRLSQIDRDNLINLDILENEDLKGVLSQIQPKTVFNLSAYGAYSRQTDPEKIHATNYLGTLNLIRALSETGCEAFVQAGTSSEYGLNCSAPSENDELVPNSDYAVSKVGASYLIKYYGKIRNFPCVNLRMYSVYGPWEERDRLIPSLVSSCTRGELPNFAKKNISRDFVYIDDCTSALIRAALTLCKTSPGLSVNIATGKKTTLEEVADIAKRIFNIKQEPVFGSMPNREWDLDDWYGNPTLAAKTMNWESRTKFEDGLLLTASWEKIAAKKLKNVHVPKRQKKISAIFACYKDNQSIPFLYERTSATFKSTGYDYEIIFVNDGSPLDDETVIRQISENDCQVIGVSHSRNFGSQSAFISGMEISTGDAVVLMDGDGQDPPEIIPQFIEKWEQGYDVVYGQRVKREAPLYMQILYKLFYRIFTKLSDIKIPVDAGDFSLIDRKAVDHILKFHERDVFLRGLRAWVGFKQTGVAYKRPERLFGKSTNNFSKNIWWAKKGIFSFSTRPLVYIQSVGFSVFVITLILAAYYLIEYFLVKPQGARGITTIVLLMLSIGSIQILSISILGDYIAKITEEVKDRPRFIRENIIVNGRAYHNQEITKMLGKIKERSE